MYRRRIGMECSTFDDDVLATMTDCSAHCAVTSSTIRHRCCPPAATRDKARSIDVNKIVGVRASERTRHGRRSVSIYRRPSVDLCLLTGSIGQGPARPGPDRPPAARPDGRLRGRLLTDVIDSATVADDNRRRGTPATTKCSRISAQLVGDST